MSLSHDVSEILPISQPAASTDITQIILMKSVLENFPGIQPQPIFGQLVKHTQRTPKRLGRSDATPQTFGSSNKGDVGLMVDFLMV